MSSLLFTDLFSDLTIKKFDILSFKETVYLGKNCPLGDANYYISWRKVITGQSTKR